MWKTKMNIKAIVIAYTNFRTPSSLNNTICEVSHCYISFDFVIIFIAELARQNELLGFINSQQYVVKHYRKAIQNFIKVCRTFCFGLLNGI